MAGMILALRGPVSCRILAPGAIRFLSAQGSRPFGVLSQHRGVDKAWTFSPRFASGSRSMSLMNMMAQSREQPILLAVVVSVSLGAYLFYKETERNAEQSKKQILNDPVSSPKDFLLSQAPPAIEPSRLVRRPGGDFTGLKLTLYQFQTCPFCCKVRALLDYCGLDYDVVEVNSVTRKQTSWSKYRKVPILVAESPDGKIFQINDSSLITSAFTSYLHDRSQDLARLLEFYPKSRFIDAEDSFKEKADIENKYALMFRGDPVKLVGKSEDDIYDERLWRRWADDSLVHKLSPNVYRTPSEALESFLWFDKVGEWDKNFATWERYLVIYVGAAAMYFLSKRLKRRYGLKKDVRQSLYNDCDKWVMNLRRKRRKFLGGKTPNLADLAVYGYLSAIEGCQAFQDLLQNTEMGPWFYATKEFVAEGRGRAAFVKAESTQES